jgi:hypothetical protein
MECAEKKLNMPASRYQCDTTNLVCHRVDREGGLEVPNVNVLSIINRSG